MKKHRSGWEREKSRKKAEDELKQVITESKKVTDFLYKRTKKRRFRSDVHYCNCFEFNYIE